MIRAVTLPGAGAGVSFFLNPDFSKLSPEAALVALGHAFFSLSLGMGILLTYGAYVDKRQSLGPATLAIGAGDLIYAFIAGLIIFPTTASFGIEPNAGPSLVFIALPAAFSAMPLGAFRRIVLRLASDRRINLLRLAAGGSDLVCHGPLALGTHQSRCRYQHTGSAGRLTFRVVIRHRAWAYRYRRQNFFDWLDFITSNILLPIGA